MATMIAPAALVVGAARVPLQFGLFSVLPFRAEGSDRWLSGVQFESMTCAPAGGIGAIDCDPDVATIGLPKEFTEGMGDGGDASPFVVYGHYTCSPIGNSFQHAQDMADSHLFTREESRVEQALWTGDLGNTPNFAGANGYGAPTNLGTFAPRMALATLEGELATEYGSQGVIHMSRKTASLLGDAIETKGGRMVTRLGTPVVAGAGYGDDKMVASAALFAYRSEVFASSNRPGDLLDRGTNDLFAIAERSYLVGFDSCGLLEVTLDTVNEIV